MRGRTFSTYLALASAALCSSGCEPSSEVEQAVRDGGLGDASAADGGLSGQDGHADDDLPPPLIQPPVANWEAPASDAGVGASTSRNPPAADAAQTSIDASGTNDSGPLAELEDDAGTDPPVVSPCTTQDCLCTTQCDRGIALLCLAEPPIEECVLLCAGPVAGCARESLAVQVCKATRPDESYYCDPDLLSFSVRGCEVEEAALQACRTR